MAAAREEWKAQHSLEIQQRRDAEASLREETRKEAAEQLKKFFEAQADEVTANEARAAQRQLDLEAEIAALENADQKMDWAKVKEIVTRVMSNTETFTLDDKPHQESAQNMDRLLDLAAKQMSQQTSMPAANLI